MKTPIKLAVAFASIGMVAFALTACNDKVADDGKIVPATPENQKAINALTNNVPGGGGSGAAPGPGPATP